jgi:hypothetical protein
MAAAIPPPADGAGPAAAYAAPDLAECEEALISLCRLNIQGRMCAKRKGQVNTDLAALLSDIPEGDFDTTWEAIKNRVAITGSNLTDEDIDACEEPEAMKIVRGRCKYPVAYNNMRATMSRLHTKVRGISSRVIA